MSILDDSKPFSIDYKPETVNGAAGVAVMLGILALGVSWYFYQLPYKSAKMLFFIAAGPALAWGCFAVAYGTARIVREKRPALQVDDCGIVCHHTLGDTVHFSWDQIGGFRVRAEQAVKNQTMPVLEIVDTAHSPKVLTSLNMNTLDYKGEDLIDQLEAYAATQRTSAGYAVPEEVTPLMSLFSYKKRVVAGLVFFGALGVLLSLQSLGIF